MNDTKEPLVDHMAKWKEMGRTGDGLRMLMIRQYYQRNLESYAAYVLDEAAARLEQLEAALTAAGVPIPAPAEPDKIARAIKAAGIMIEKEYDGHDIKTFVWGQWGEEARKAMIAHYTTQPEGGGN